MDSNTYAAVGALIALAVNYVVKWAIGHFAPSATPVAPVAPPVVPVDPTVPTSNTPIIDAFLSAIKNVLLSKLNVPTSATTVSDFTDKVVTEADVVREVAAKLK